VVDGYSLDDLGGFFGVSHNTITAWLREVGITPDQKEFKYRRLEIYEETRRYTPPFQNAHFSCACCVWEWLCEELQETREPLMCEALDEIQLIGLELEEKAA